MLSLLNFSFRAESVLFNRQIDLSTNLHVRVSPPRPPARRTALVAALILLFSCDQSRQPTSRSNWRKFFFYVATPAISLGFSHTVPKKTTAWHTSLYNTIQINDFKHDLRLQITFLLRSAMHIINNKTYLLNLCYLYFHFLLFL